LVKRRLRNQDGEQEKNRNRQKDNDPLALGNLGGSSWNGLHHANPPVQPPQVSHGAQAVDGPEVIIDADTATGDA